MRRGAFFFLAALGTSALLSLPSPALADDEPVGKSAFDEAMADLSAGRYKTACPALLKAHRAEPRPISLFYLAECEEKSGRIATAAVHYDDYLAMFDQLSDSEQKDERERERLASARREALEKRIPHVTIRLPADAPGTTRVTRQSPDGGDAVQIAVGVPLPIDPGEHVASTEVPGRPRYDKRFFVHEGDKLFVDLPVAKADESITPTRRAEPLKPVPSLLPPLDPGIPARRVTAYVLGGVGAVSVLGGVVTGAIVWAQKSPIEQNCKSYNNKTICNGTGQSAKDTARISGIVSNVAFPVGLASIATAAILYFTEPKQSKFGTNENRVQVGAYVLPSSAALQVGVSW